MKQELNGSSLPKREGYYDYMVRRNREEDAKLGIDNRSDKSIINELENRIKKLEIDMAHLLSQK